MMFDFPLPLGPEIVVKSFKRKSLLFFRRTLEINELNFFYVHRMPLRFCVFEEVSVFSASLRLGVFPVAGYDFRILVIPKIHGFID